MISGQSAMCHNFLASTLDQRCPATGGCVGLVVVRINKHLWCVLYHWVKADPGAPPPPPSPLCLSALAPAFQLRRRPGVVTWTSPTRGNQKHGLHVGSRQSFIPSFISAEAVATLRRLDHVCRAALLVFVCFPEISLITAPGWEIALWLINPN